MSAFSGVVLRVHQHHGEPPVRSTSVGGAGTVPACVCPAGGVLGKADPQGSATPCQLYKHTEGTLVNSASLGVD